MSHHVIVPKLLRSGDVEIMLVEGSTGEGKFVILSAEDALHLAADIKALARAGEKL